jgi:hypothetical protein
MNMLDEKQILEKTQQLPPQERAAALAHYIYVTTSNSSPEWSARVPTNWEDLAPDARAFNLASAATWARSKAILKAWIEATESIESGTS